jgi:hypothetical protein
MEQFGSGHYRSLSLWLEPTAMQTSRGIVLAKAVADELRRRLIVLPSIPVIDRLSAEAVTRAQRKSFVLLTKDLSMEQRATLDGLLELRSGSPYSTLSWLRLPAGAPTPKAVMAHIERLQTIRSLGLSPELPHRLHQNRLLQIAREGAQCAVYQLKEYEPDRRHGTLVALLIETAATLTDEILDLHDRLIGSFFTQSKNRYDRAFAEQGKAINDKVRLYAKVHQDSGTSVHKPARISRAGSRHLRRALYMPALAAVRWDPHMKAFYEALLARHKRKLQALVAVARKLLHALYGIFRSRTPYDGRKLFPAMTLAENSNPLPASI